ncbi:MAG: hypothetical protein JWN66_3355 [Sphingomonas bacterium]|uniref:hypothetical protein n=1 Tax=Sphingomonas bacterium TaxID=1895847 RepID=UPI0026186329|nr:hypothetical protein [Sphingomonas bacterium]MDB5706239.1 hypothetical protein [Sphingomonas bacterium]
MILGLSVAAFTQLHVLISLVGIAAGLVFLAGLLAGRWLGLWNQIFLVFTILTSVTGFFFHSKMIGPPHVVGVISLVDLAVALVALYGFRRAGLWRPVYTITAVVALYLNVFVLIVQLFQKVAFLNAFAPTGSEPPFAIAQGLALIAFAVAGYVAVRRPVGPV